MRKRLEGKLRMREQTSATDSGAVSPPERNKDDTGCNKVIQDRQRNNGGAVEEVTFGDGKTPTRGRWPFSDLKKGQFFEVTDLEKHVALRTAASRARKKLKRVFAVRKVTSEATGAQVLRVYRE
jgi:hypothetical protein